MSSTTEQPGFKDILKKRREELGHTQRQAREILGVSKHTYMNWEHGRFKPSAAHLAALQNYLKVPQKVLLLSLA